MALPLHGLRRFRYGRYFGDGVYPVVPKYFVLQDRNTGTFFNDSSINTVHTTAIGTAFLDPSQSKFGGYSLRCIDGIVSPAAVTDTGTVLSPGSQDFCIETWVRRDSKLPIVRDVAWQFLDTGTSQKVELRHDIAPGTLRIRGTYTPAFNQDIPKVLKLDTWQHVAFTRQGSGGTDTIRVFVDGIKVYEGTQASPAVGVPSSSFTIGGDSSVHAVNGWIDEFRYVI